MSGTTTSFGGCSFTSCRYFLIIVVTLLAPRCKKVNDSEEEEEIKEEDRITEGAEKIADERIAQKGSHDDDQVVWTRGKAR